MDKYQRKAIVGIERENERNDTYHSKTNPQIDSSRTTLNFKTIRRDGTYFDHINKRIKEVNQKRKIKDDAVFLCSFILGASPSFFQDKPKEVIKEFFFDCSDFFVHRYGAENIVSAIVHLDETTPHMHLNMIPFLDGRLCAKKLFDRVNLKSLQSDFYDSVGKRWGLERGKEGSIAKHLDTVSYKTKMMTAEAEMRLVQADKAEQRAEIIITEAKQAKKQAEPIRSLIESYGQAKDEKIPFWGKDKETEIIALRTKTKALEKDLEYSIKDRSTLFKELQKAEKQVKMNEQSYKILTRINEYDSQAFGELQEKSKQPKVTHTPNFHSNNHGKGNSR